jgi:predicted secreted protein
MSPTVRITFALAIYLVIWWTVLFAILPLGVRTQGEDGSVVPGTPESAPTRPRLVRVVVLTTLVSAVVFALVLAAMRYDVLGLNRLLEGAAGR